MAGGWLIGVLVHLPDEPKPLRHYFAVGHEDQGKSEWTAVDRARELSKQLEESRDLGWKHPRRWLTG